MSKKKNYSKKFHNKINNLLKKAGFKIEDVNYHKSGPDTVCVAGDVKILVQCKSTTEANKPYKSLERLADEYTTKVKRYKAKVAILAFQNYKIRDKHLGDKLLKRNKVVVWNNKIIDYYKKTVDSTRHYAKYSMMGDLGITDNGSGCFTIPALKVEQNGVEFFIFKMLPEDLLKYSYVFRRQYNPKAYQRMLKKSRLKEIAAFINTKGNFFPNNIVCVFKSKVEFKDGKLLIPKINASIWVVDGQHRLFGFCHANDSSKNKLYQLICVGFNIQGSKRSYLSDDQQAKLFSDINSKSKKIPQDLLLEILDLFGVYDLRVAIVKRLAKTDLFVNKIQTHGGKGEIHFTTFVTTPPMNELLDSAGPIIKYSTSKRFKKLSKEGKEKKFEDICFKIIKDYFTIIKGLNKKQWRSPGRFVIATDRGIRGFLRLLIEILEYTKKWDRASVKKILECLKGFDFRNNKLKGKYLGEAGADEFVKDLVMKIKQIKPDFGPQSNQIGRLSVEYNEVKKAEDFIEDQFKNFEGQISGELSFIDESTIDYLKFIPQACGIKIITDSVKPDETTIRNKIKNEMRDWRHVHFKKITARNNSGQEIHPSHGRWIADEKKRINLEVDLKKDALKKRHNKNIYNNPHLSKEVQDFKKIWDASLNDLEDIFKINHIEIKSIS